MGGVGVWSQTAGLIVWPPGLGAQMEEAEQGIVLQPLFEEDKSWLSWYEMRLLGAFR